MPKEGGKANAGRSQELRSAKYKKPQYCLVAPTLLEVKICYKAGERLQSLPAALSSVAESEIMPATLCLNSSLAYSEALALLVW